jgi:hypothetical protein
VILHTGTGTSPIRALLENIFSALKSGNCYLGDHAYKQNKKLPLMEQMISPLPDIRTLEIDPITDTWMILGKKHFHLVRSFFLVN